MPGKETWNKLCGWIEMRAGEIEWGGGTEEENMGRNN